MKRPRARRRLALAAAAMAAATGPATAHPHVWISVATTVVYGNGAVTALRHRWTFDEIYTAMAIQGLDANNDGAYDRAELAELAKVNVHGLKEFGYFTTAKLGEEALAFAAPVEYFMELAEVARPGAASAQAADASQGSIWSKLTGALTGGAASDRPKVLAFEFTLPLERPVPGDAEGFSFSVADPSFFIWFDLAKDDPVRLAAGAPPGCRLTVAEPGGGALAMPQLGDRTGGVIASMGAARTVTLSCAK